MITLQINGQAHSADVAEDMPLLWFLRERLGLTGTKYGCGLGQCGACTVHVDGQASRACMLPVKSLEGRRITTIEGLGGASLHAVQRAWIEEDVPQCGYCQAGQIMAAAALLARQSAPADADIAAVRVPTMAILGSADPALPRVKALKKRWPALKVVVVAGATHSARHPRTLLTRQEFTAEVRAFIASHR